MNDWQMASLLLALHNIAFALGAMAKGLMLIAIAVFWYPWIGGFGSSPRRTVTIQKES